ncbi:MAG: YtxH domain-containing protein [Nitrososphaeraceae archaeon]
MTEEDSFEKVKKGLKETGEGLKETGEGLKDGVEETAEAVKEGVEDTVEVVADTTEDVKEGVEETADVFEDTAKEATVADTYTSSDEERKSREFNEAGGKEPMNPEDIASHEPTAVKRDKKQGTSGDPV